MNSQSIASTGFAIVCVIWVCTVPMVYLITRDELALQNWFWMSANGRSPAWHVVAMMLLQPAIPVGLILGLRWIWSRGWTSSWTGVVFGFVVGLWLDSLALLFPYVGAYPNLPGVMIGSLLFNGQNAFITFYAPIFATNGIVWPLLGWYCVKVEGP